MVLRRNTAIGCFVACWLALFCYETFRAGYLSRLVLRLRSALAPSKAEGRVEGLAGRPLPKFSLLFPPAGWIMFYNVDRSYGFAEVYAQTPPGAPALLDPHDIFETTAVGYDNIHRNVLVGVLSREHAPNFCRYLRRKFPEAQLFTVVYAQYPDVVNAPDEIRRQIAYRCQ